jgi:hypothetical protein
MYDNLGRVHIGDLIAKRRYLNVCHRAINAHISAYFAAGRRTSQSYVNLRLASGSRNTSSIATSCCSRLKNQRLISHGGYAGVIQVLPIRMLYIMSVQMNSCSCVLAADQCRRETVKALNRGHPMRGIPRLLPYKV